MTPIRSLLVKRLFDIFLSLSGIIISLPLWPIISLLIYIQDKNAIYYLQERVGKNSRIFKVIKFRSMIPAAEQDTGPVHAKEDDSRATSIGRLLRKTALDELPQILNILKGDMSFVGPRPLRTEEIESHPYAAMRQSMPPGLTGTAQLFAPKDATFQEKIEYDIWYIKNRTLPLDIRLIFMSCMVTLLGRWEVREAKIPFIDRFSLLRPEV